MMVSVHIDDHYWAALNEEDRTLIVAWGFVIAGEAMAEGKRSGPVFTGQDGGYQSPHVGRWSAY
jgi:hypothetical protein